MGGEQIVIDCRPLQGRRAMGPLDEAYEVLFARIDTRVPDDPQEPNDPPEGREELVFARHAADAAPPLEGLTERILLRPGELAGSDFLDNREELDFALERNPLGDAREGRGDEV